VLDWASDSPILLLTLARPELAERRPGWGGGRNALGVRLDLLPAPAIAQLLGALADGLPVPVVNRIVAGAGGLPLYAVETVRMLVDRGVVARVGDRDRVVAEVGEISTPPGLVALLAARIDALPGAEAALIRELSVLGASFSRATVRALDGRPDEDLDRLLQSLLRKEILRVEVDRLSPQQGDYRFTQELIRTVAYNTLSRRDRKRRHLAVAHQLRTAYPNDGEDVAQLIAAHLRDAYLAARNPAAKNPAADDAAAENDPDVDLLREDARAGYERAGQRAMAIGATDSAGTCYLIAAELSSRGRQRAEMLAAAGEALSDAGHVDQAITALTEAIELHRETGQLLEAARAASTLASRAGQAGLHALAIEQARAGLELLGPDDSGPEAAALYLALGYALRGSGAEPLIVEEHLRRALDLAQGWELDHVLSRALAAMGWLRFRQGRRPVSHQPDRGGPHAGAPRLPGLGDHPGCGPLDAAGGAPRLQRSVDGLPREPASAREPLTGVTRSQASTGGSARA